MTGTSWQSAVGFADRLSNIMAISTTLQTHDRSGKDYNAASLARELEAQAYQEATSEVDYQRRCSSIQEDLKPREHPEDQLDDDDGDSTDRPTLAIGPFKDAVYHRNGLYSTIYKASASPLGAKSGHTTIVALKVTTPLAMSPPHNSAREARILMHATTKDSHTIPLIDALTEPGGHLILVFPFMHYDLDFLQQRHPDSITADVKHQIELSLFSALAHIHDLGMIHRDIKPSNILLRTLTGPIYLADFGIAWSPNDPDSEPADQKITDVGTTCYRPPELLFGYTNYDQSLDMWAAGCVIAELEHPEHKALFNAGPLGSELALISSIFHIMGTPDETTWPSTTKLPDWGKMAFNQYPAQPWTKILNGVTEKAIELVSRLVRYEMSERLTAKKALELCAY